MPPAAWRNWCTSRISPFAVSGTIAAYLGISVSGGSYTATLDNQTYSANGAFPLALTAGTHTTKDTGGNASTFEFADAVCQAIKS